MAISSGDKGQGGGSKANKYKPPAWLNSGKYIPKSARGSVKRLRGAGDTGVHMESPAQAQALNTNYSAEGSVRRMRGTPALGTQLQRPQVQTYVANPQTYKAKDYYPKPSNQGWTPSWGTPLPNDPRNNYMSPAWMPQSDVVQGPSGPVDLATGQNVAADTMVQGHSAGTNRVNDPSLRDYYYYLKAVMNSPQASSYSPFSTSYGWGGGYGGGGGGGGGGAYDFSQSPWLGMGLRNWNFGG